MGDTEYCPLCRRPLSDTSNRHHLIPRTFGGKGTVVLHKVCHRQIHATFTERELQNYYHTIDRILEHEGIRKFVRWVRTKPLDFHVKTGKTKRLKGKRRK